MVTTSQVCLVDGHRIRLARETPRTIEGCVTGITSGNFDCGRLHSDEVGSFRELYPILEEEVQGRIVRGGMNGMPLEGHRQPEVIKNHLDLIPGMRELLSGEMSNLEYPASRGYVRWVLWDYSFCSIPDSNPQVLV